MKMLMLSLALCFSPTFAHADLGAELAKIENLIGQVQRMDAVFIRNGQAYSGRDAADHLRQKLNYALQSSSSEDVTARAFVLQVASQSSLTRIAYTIRFSDGRTVKARDWLLNRLAELE